MLEAVPFCEDLGLKRSQTMTEEGDEVRIDECEEEDNVDFKVRVRGPR